MVGLVGSAAAASLLLTGWVRRNAANWSVLDRPTGRGVHDATTPRGGGLAVAIAVLGSVGVGWAAGLIDAMLASALLGGGFVIALVGWLDDRYDLTPVTRLVVHFAAGIFAVVLLGGLPEIRLGAAAVPLGWLGDAVAVVGVVWAINLYNFMDGIDGLAAGEAVQVGAGAALLSLWLGDVGTALACALVAGSALGFLRWNWAPARIFLGDTGSGLFGFMFATIALFAERGEGLAAWAWLLLLGVFGFDATVTLIRRVVRGDRWYRPHRLHAYQRLAGSGWSHARVVLGVAALNGWLLALAAVGTLRPGLFGPVVATALASLLAAYLAVERVTPFATSGGGSGATASGQTA